MPTEPDETLQSREAMLRELNQPNSRVWRHSDGSLNPFPGGVTRGEWAEIAARNAIATEGYEND